MISDNLIASIISGGVTLLGIVIANIKIFKIADKQNEIHKQINGQQDLLISASKGQSLAEGKLETKNELIEVLKKIEPLPTNEQEKTVTN